MDPNKDKELLQKRENEKTKEFKVKVCSLVVNVRSAPNEQAKIVDVVYRNNILTITKVHDGWGKIKDSDNWLYLKFTDKL